ncbi:DUF697 domain-containing protein [Oscillatoria sp. FACHB-1407]|uniref:slr1306 family protein n=1 Tax=Oscillatoria sp. FACHB-1407 TaxID=2692847 RepID=UPI00168376F6|nr:DUF697 domain-containing protein [Oscillatoria sp. FACHB-1407]MBD2462882.1 DUF697 domain-containing protein [Oscillatoria sp. FACHB-1407]
MAFATRRPILVGGLGLTFSLWLLESLHPSTTHLGGSIVWAAIALGSGFWWFKQQLLPSKPDVAPLPVDRPSVEKELASVEQRIQLLQTELPDSRTDSTALIAGLRQQLAHLTANLDRKQARLAIMGGRGVGKTTLTHQLAARLMAQAPASDATPSPAESSVGLGATDIAEVSKVDLVLFVTAGDLTDPEFQAVSQLLNRQQRVLMVFNKQDQYLPDERVQVLQSLRDRLQNQMATEDIIAIAAQPAPIKVRRYAADGSLQESVEQSTPDLTGLTERVATILQQEGQRLVLATVMRQAKALKATIQTELNQIRRDRALPLIEQSQWIAAATAFANPVPSLDLLATAAINTQLVMDLGAIYQQPFSLEQAKTVAGNMAELMVKLGLVELSSQAIAPLLKSHVLTYVAGGLMQGISAAYLTRIAGLSLITYFEEQSLLIEAGAEPAFQLDRLTQKLKAVFQDNQRTAFLQTLVKQGIGRLMPDAPTQASLPSA